VGAEHIDYRYAEQHEYGSGGKYQSDYDHIPSDFSTVHGILLSYS
jgi:hypothetical protein